MRLPLARRPPHPLSGVNRMITMRVRPLAAADIEDYARLRSALWPDEDAEELRAEAPRFLAGVGGAGGAPGVAFVLVQPDGRLGGFIEVAIRPSAEGCVSDWVGYIEGWYVDQALRRQGAGRELAAAEEWARAQGCVEIASDCLLDNDVSLAAHLALGYEEVERLIVFRKQLAAA